MVGHEEPTPGGRPQTRTGGAVSADVAMPEAEAVAPTAVPATSGRRRLLATS